MKKVLGLIVAGFILMSNSISYAGEIDMLVNKLAEKKVITYGEAQQIITESGEAMRKDLAMGKAKTAPDWVQDISMKGDLRLRHQIDWADNKNYPRIRERMRLRVGFGTRVMDNLSAGFGIASGSEKISDSDVSVSTTTGNGSVDNGSIVDSEPTSTNHTFSGFGKAMLMIDYAYLAYDPYTWLTVTGGKMKAKTQVWNTTDLLWDGDINPDGVALNISKDVSGETSIFFNGSWLVLGEKNSSANAPDIYIAQPGVSVKPTEKISIKAAVAYQTLNVNGKNCGYWGTPAMDYVCTNPSAEIKFKEMVGAYTLKIMGDVISNSDSKATTDNSGSAFGVQFGHDKTKELGQWNLKYLARKLEKNAWLSKLGDSDAYGGDSSSGMEGFEAVLTMGLTPSAVFSIDYYAMDKINGASATTPKSLVQFDLVYKF